MATENIEIRVRANGAREAGRAIGGIGTSAAAAGRGVGQLQGIIAAAFGAAAIRKVAQAADSFTQIQNRLRLITNSTADLNNLNELVFAQAQRTRSSYEAQADLVARISRASQDLGASQAEVLKVSEAFAQSLQISGATAQEAASASLQFGQALGSGVLQSQELTAILENDARLARVIADEFGVGVGQLKKLGAEGALTSERVFGAVLKNAEQLNAEFEQIAPTIEQGFLLAANSITRVIGDLELGEILGTAFAGIGDSISNLRPDIVELVGNARAFTIQLFGTLDQFFTQIEIAINAVEGTFASIGGSIAEARAEGGFFNDVLESAAAASRDANAAINELPEGIQQAARLAASPYLVIVDALSSVEDATDDVVESTEELDRLGRERSSLLDTLAGKEDVVTQAVLAQLDATNKQVAALRELAANPPKADESKGAGGAAASPISEDDIKAAEKLLQGAKSEIELIQDELVEAQRLGALGLLGGDASQQDLRVIEQLKGQLREATAEADGTAEALERAKNIVSGTLTEVEVLTAELAEAQELSNAGFFEGVEGGDNAIARLIEQLDEAKEKANETTDQMSKFAEQAARNMQDQFANFLFDPFQDGLDGLLRGFIDTIRRMLSELLAAKALEAFFNAAAGATGGGFGGFFTAAAKSFAPSGNAMGGEIPAGQSRLVGERGPELFTPSQNGQVTPNSQLGGQQAAPPIVIVEQDPQAIVAAMGTAAGRQQIITAIQADPAIFRAALGVAQ